MTSDPPLPCDMAAQQQVLAGKAVEKSDPMKRRKVSFTIYEAMQHRVMAMVRGEWVFKRGEVEIEISCSFDSNNADLSCGFL